MERDQLNATEMFGTVSTTMQLNQAVWTPTPAIVQAMTELNEKIAAIAEKLRHQKTPITGITDQKTLVRGKLEDKILEVADQIAALAAKNGDMDLAAQAELHLSQLDKLPDEELEGTGTRISGLLGDHLDELADYGLATGDQTKLDELVTEFHGAKSGPRTAIAGRKGETDTIPDLIRATKSLLRNRLDKLMTRFKKSNPEFFAAYRSARVIVDRGHPAPAKQAAPAKNPQ